VSQLGIENELTHRIEELSVVKERVVSVDQPDVFDTIDVDGITVTITTKRRSFTVPLLSLPDGVSSDADNWRLHIGYYPYQDIVIGTSETAIDRKFNNNQEHGIQVASSQNGSIGSTLHIDGVQCNSNTNQGLTISSVENVRVTRSHFVGNHGNGIDIRDYALTRLSATEEVDPDNPPDPVFWNMTNNINIYNDCTVESNRNGGIYIQAANDVTINNVAIYTLGRTHTSGCIRVESLAFTIRHPTGLIYHHKRIERLEIGASFFGDEEDEGWLLDKIINWPAQTPWQDNLMYSQVDGEGIEVGENYNLVDSGRYSLSFYSAYDPSSDLPSPFVLNPNGKVHAPVRSSFSYIVRAIDSGSMYRKNSAEGSDAEWVLLNYIREPIILYDPPLIRFREPDGSIGRIGRGYRSPKKEFNPSYYNEKEESSRTSVKPDSTVSTEIPNPSYFRREFS
jgi:hypothetical protein